VFKKLDAVQNPGRAASVAVDYDCKI